MSISPDGKRIAYHVPGGYGGELEVSNLDGSGATLIYNGNEADTPSWSPDGNWIVFVGGTIPNAANMLYKIHPDGSGLTELVSNDAVGAPLGRATFSRDASMIAFGSNGGGNSPSGLYVVNANGTNLHLVTADAGGASEPVWGPGNVLYFMGFPAGSAFPNGYGQLFRINADGSGETELTSTGSVLNDPALSPDGSTIALDWGPPGGARAYRRSHPPEAHRRPSFLVAQGRSPGESGSPPTRSRTPDQERSFR